MRVARVDPSRVDARTVGFRLAPRINAAGRLHRADAGARADAHRRTASAPRDRRGARRRQRRAALHRAADPVRGRGAGGRARRPAPPTCWPARAGTRASSGSSPAGSPSATTARPSSSRWTASEGTGSGRSIPAFDLLGGLNACAQHLLRHGGHRAAAGCAIAAASVEAFRAAFEAHAARVLAPEDLVPVRASTPSSPATSSALELAEELGRLAPFGHRQPGASRCWSRPRGCDPRPMGEGKHVRFTVASRRRAPAPSRSALGAALTVRASRSPPPFTLELNEYNGAVEPRLVLRDARPARQAPIELVGEPRLVGRRCARSWNATAACSAGSGGDRARGRARRPCATVAAAGSPGPSPRSSRAASPSWSSAADARRSGPGACAERWAGSRSRPGTRSRRARVARGELRPGRGARPAARRPHLRRAWRSGCPARAGPTWRGVRLSWSFARRVLDLGARPARPAERGRTGRCGSARRRGAVAAPWTGEAVAAILQRPQARGRGPGRGRRPAAARARGARAGRRSRRRRGWLSACRPLAGRTALERSAGVPASERGRHLARRARPSRGPDRRRPRASPPCRRPPAAA